MSLRERIQRAVREGDLDDIQTIVSEEPRAVRFLVGLSFHTDERIQSTAAKGVAVAARFHPELVQRVVRRLVWAMNDESGTNAITAPRVVQEIAWERPDLLVPMIPDLVRLAGDLNLYDGLSCALRTVANSCPGEIGRSMTDSLRSRFGNTECKERRNER